METTTITDASLGLDLNADVACHFDDCPHPSVWAGFHQCLKPQTIIVCAEHREELEDTLANALFPPLGIPCEFGHRHFSFEVSWRRL